MTPVARWLCGLVVLTTASVLAQNLLFNGDFEINQGPGTVPHGWQAVDECAGYEGWVAPRCELVCGEVLPFDGRWMVAVDTERMNVDTTGEDFATPRAALYQTIQVHRGVQGTFRVRYNDNGSSSGAWVSCLRLGYTVDDERISAIGPPAEMAPPQESGNIPATRWGPALYKTSVDNGGTGDWTEAALPVVVPPGAGLANLTLWIGVFDNSSGDETGYWRVDAATFELDAR